MRKLTDSSTPVSVLLTLSLPNILLFLFMIAWAAWVDQSLDNKHVQRDVDNDSGISQQYLATLEHCCMHLHCEKEALRWKDQVKFLV